MAPPEQPRLPGAGSCRPCFHVEPAVGLPAAACLQPSQPLLVPPLVLCPPGVVSEACICFSQASAWCCSWNPMPNACERMAQTASPVLRAGERLALFVGAPPEDKLPKHALPGQLLVGTLALARDGAGHAPGALELTYRSAP